MNASNELLAMAGISTTKEQAMLESEVFHLINFQYQINHKEQHIIQIHQDSSYRQVISILRGDIILDSGSFRLNGKELIHLPVFMRNQIVHQKIGFINFDERLMPYLTILENIYVGFGNLPKNMNRFRTNIQALLHWFALDDAEDCFPKECSPSQRIDVQFLRAFVHQPQLVVVNLSLDIPFHAIIRLQKLAAMTDTALWVFMQLDPANDREKLFSGEMIRRLIVEKIGYSYEYFG